MLFIWSKIYGWISSKRLYVWLDDENTERRTAYKNAIKQITASYEKYKEGFETYMDTLIAEAKRQSEEARAQSAEYERQSAEYERQSAEYERQSAEYERQSAEYERQSAEYERQSAEILNSTLENLAWFYNRYKKDPNTIPAEELNQWKEQGKQVIQNCKKGNVDYKAKLSKEMLEFYGEK